MQVYKEILESLQKMTNVRLNIAILLTCLFLIFISPNDHFILDPVSKLIPQSLILITSIRLVFSIINMIHSIISKKIEKQNREKQEIIEKQKKEQEKQILKETMRDIFNTLDVYQLHIIKELIGKNNSSHPKGASLFSLCNQNITQVVSTGETSQSVALTSIAKDIIKTDFNDDISHLEISAATRAFNSMTHKEIDCFRLLLEKEMIKTYFFDRYNKRYYLPSHDVFKEYSKSILFMQPQKGYEYILNPTLKDVLSSY